MVKACNFIAKSTACKNNYLFLLSFCKNSKDKYINDGSITICDVMKAGFEYNLPVIEK